MDLHDTHIQSLNSESNSYKFDENGNILFDSLNNSLEEKYINTINEIIKKEEKIENQSQNSIISLSHHSNISHKIDNIKDKSYLKTNTINQIENLIEESENNININEVKNNI